MATEKKELSRGEVAHRLGCSQWQIVRFEREGRIKVRREKPEGQHGRVWYAIEDVEKLASEWKPQRARNKLKVDSQMVQSNVRGKVAACAFRMLSENDALPPAERKGLDELFRAIVIATEADPILIRQIFQEWDNGYEKKRAIELQEKLDADERERQRQHDKRAREDTFREWKLKLAAAEKKAAIEAQAAVEMRMKAKVGS